MSVDLTRINSRIALITAESDTLRRKCSRILGRETTERNYNRVPSNRFAHDREIIPILEAFQDDQRS